MKKQSPWENMALWEKLALWFLAITALLIVSLIFIFYYASHSANRAHFVTQALPKAHLNQPYYAKIKIEAAIVEDSVVIKSSNNDIAVTPRIYEAWRDVNNKPVYRNDYSDLTVMGIVTENKPIVIKITGNTYGSMFVGKEFEKEYMIDVLESAR